MDAHPPAACVTKYSKTATTAATATDLSPEGLCPIGVHVPVSRPDELVDLVHCPAAGVRELLSIKSVDLLHLVLLPQQLRLYPQHFRTVQTIQHVKKLGSVKL